MITDKLLTKVTSPTLLPKVKRQAALVERSQDMLSNLSPFKTARIIRQAADNHTLPSGSTMPRIYWTPNSFLVFPLNAPKTNKNAFARLGLYSNQIDSFATTLHGGNEPNIHNHPNYFVSKQITPGEQSKLTHTIWKFKPVKRIPHLAALMEKTNAFLNRPLTKYQYFNNYVRLRNNPFKQNKIVKARIVDTYTTKERPITLMPSWVFHSVKRTGDKLVTLLILPGGNNRDKLIYLTPWAAKKDATIKLHPKNHTPLPNWVVWDEVISTLHNLAQQDPNVEKLLACPLGKKQLATMAQTTPNPST